MAGAGDAAGEPLAARVGIATGLVMVGELIGEGAAQEQTVVGETPTWRPGCRRWPSPAAWSSARRPAACSAACSSCDDLGHARLKGFAEPLAAFAVRRRGPRREPLRGAARAAPRRRWSGASRSSACCSSAGQQAKDGDGQVVLLSGEPGIGKSRMIRALRERLGVEPYTPLRYYCSPYHTNSALYPVIQHAGTSAAGFARATPPRQRLDKLEALLRRAERHSARAAPLLAALLGIDGESLRRLTLTAAGARAAPCRRWSTSSPASRRSSRCSRARGRALDRPLDARAVRISRSNACRAPVSWRGHRPADFQRDGFGGHPNVTR